SGTIFPAGYWQCSSVTARHVQQNAQQLKPQPWNNTLFAVVHGWFVIESVLCPGREGRCGFWDHGTMFHVFVFSVFHGTTRLTEGFNFPAGLFHRRDNIGGTVVNHKWCSPGGGEVVDVLHVFGPVAGGVPNHLVNNMLCISDILTYTPTSQYA